MAPAGVSIHTARVPFGWRGERQPTPLGFEAVRTFAEPPYIDEAAELLASAPVNVIAFAFTSTSYLHGPEGDVALRERLERRTHGIPVLIACASAVIALRALGVRKLAVINPPWFTTELDHLGAEYFGRQGFEVVHAAAVQLPDGQLNVHPVQIYDWVRAHAPSVAEAVFIGGNGFRAVAAVDALEAEGERPVITANQVLLWHALRLAGVEVPVVHYRSDF
jgi:maleate isomerase